MAFSSKTLRGSIERVVNAELAVAATAKLASDAHYTRAQKELIAARAALDNQIVKIKQAMVALETLTKELK